MNYIALDIGGTAVKAAIIDEIGTIIQKTSQPTPLTNFDDLIKCLTEIVEWAKAITPISGIAISQPCVTDAMTGQALSGGALGYIQGTNPSKVLGNIFNLPYTAENDGNCAALAEIWIGNARGINDLALVVCGSGIGGSVIIDRKIITGHRKFAGEFGMFITGFETDGTPIIWSANGSTLALVNAYSKRSGKDIKTLDGKIVFDLAEKGDEDAMACVESFYRIFAYGLHNIQHVCDPELILIGGAVSNRADFIDNITKELEIFYDQVGGYMSGPTVARCACGADANLIGAVYHLLNMC